MILGPKSMRRTDFFGPTFLCSSLSSTKRPGFGFPNVINRMVYNSRITKKEKKKNLFILGSKEQVGVRFILELQFKLQCR